MLSTSHPASITEAPPSRGRRVLLIDSFPSHEGAEQLTHGPLGVLRVSAAIGRDCDAVETHVLAWGTLPRNAPARALRAFLAAYRPAIVGISAFSVGMLNAIAIAEMVRDYDAKVPVVLGGAHSTSCPVGIGQYACFDFFVIGDGEKVGAQLIGSLLDGGPELQTIPSLGFRRDGQVVQTPMAELPSSLDDAPPIDWSSVDFEPYLHTRVNSFLPLDLQFEDGQFLPYLATRGCPFHCGFCCRTDGASSRKHSPARVVDDLREMRQVFGSNRFLFLDNHIHLDRRWFGSLLEHLERDLPDATFACGVMADKLDHDTIDRMVDAGFRLLFCFPESGSQRILDLMAKKIRLDGILRNMEHASQQGAIIYANFLLGWPSETAEEVEQTLRLAESPTFDLVGFCGLRYLPGTDVYDHVARLGIEPDTPEFFAQLNDPPVLADYSKSEYADFVDRGNVLNLIKLRVPHTRDKLRAAGIRARLNAFDGEPAQSPPPHSEQAPAEPPPDALASATEPEREELQSNETAELLTEYARHQWGRAPCAIVTVDTNNSPQGLRLRVEGDGSEVDVLVTKKGSGAYLMQTELLELGFGGLTLDAGQRQIFVTIARRLRRWERALIAAPEAQRRSPSVAAMLQALDLRVAQD